MTCDCSSPFLQTMQQWPWVGNLNHPMNRLIVPRSENYFQEGDGLQPPPHPVRADVPLSNSYGAANEGSTRPAPSGTCYPITPVIPKTGALHINASPNQQVSVLATRYPIDLQPHPPAPASSGSPHILTVRLSPSPHRRPWIWVVGPSLSALHGVNSTHPTIRLLCRGDFWAL
jgi:hypothetical protein